MATVTGDIPRFGRRGWSPADASPARAEPERAFAFPERTVGPGDAMVNPLVHFERTGRAIRPETYARVAPTDSGLVGGSVPLARRAAAGGDDCSIMLGGGTGVRAAAPEAASSSMSMGLGSRGTRSRIPLRDCDSCGWIRTTDLTIMSRARGCEPRRRAAPQAHENAGIRGYRAGAACARLTGVVLWRRRRVDAEAAGRYDLDSGYGGAIPWRVC
jgi:hypothetical protein